MSEFLTDLQQYAFLQHALMTGLLASLACGVIGAYVVAHRITYLAGGISHTVLAGMGAALYFKKVYLWDWFDPLYGAVIAAVVAAIIIGLVSLRAKEREDTIIGALWAVGMAVGIIFISRTPGYNEDLMSYLFGNILMVSSTDLLIMAVLDLAALGTVALFYNQFLAVCFDDEFTRLRGLSAEAYYLLLLCLTAITVVVLVTVVGIIMVIALLTLPTATAAHFSKNLRHIMGLSVILSMAFTTSGLVVSYEPNFPTGATIIVIAAGTYLAVAVATRLAKHRQP